MPDLQLSGFNRDRSRLGGIPPGPWTVDEKGTSTSMRSSNTAGWLKFMIVQLAG